MYVVKMEWEVAVSVYYDGKPVNKPNREDQF